MEKEIKLNSKKEARFEKRKKKMLAFLEIASLNDADRQKLNNNTEESEDEPSSKKLKIENCHENNDLGDISSQDMTEKISLLGKPALTKEEYEQLRKELKERKQMYKQMAQFRLKAVGEEASISVSLDNRIPLFLSDIQHLVLFAILGVHSSYQPRRWCHIERHSKLKHTLLFVVENLSLCDYTSHESLFPNLNKNFSSKLEIVTPSVYNGDLVEEIAAVPLTTTQKDKLILEYGTLQNALQSAKVFKMLKAIFPVQERVKKLVYDKKLVLPESDKFPRTHLLLSAWQLVEENYPLPLKGFLKHKYSHYVMTKDVYEEVNEYSPLFAIDCEMCRTTIGELELTRISIVNEQHELIYETFVKPYNKIVDYLSQFSGIYPDTLKNVSTRIEDVQSNIRNILPADAILVGQSLNSDLHALKLIHPYIIDTSVIFNITGDRYRKTKLKTLVKEFLDEKIQDSQYGHDSIEDSLSCLKLVQLKLRNYIEFGDAVLSGQKGCLRNYRIQGDNYFGTSLLYHVARDKTAFIVGKQEDVFRYKEFLHKKEIRKNKNKQITCTEKETNRSIVKELCQSVNNFGLSVAHLKLNEDEVHEDNIVETCKIVDKYIQRIWQNCPLNTICIILFGGSSISNGASFIQIKNNVRK